MRAFAVAWCALLFLACGGGSNKGAQEPRTDQAMTATIDEAVALFVEMGEVVMSAEDDCERMATAVGGWLDANGDRRKRINAELLRIDSPAMQEAYRQRLSRHIDVVQGMRVGVEGCAEHDGFVRAWNRLDQ